MLLTGGKTFRLRISNCPTSRTDSGQLPLPAAPSPCTAAHNPTTLATLITGDLGACSAVCVGPYSVTSAGSSLLSAHSTFSRCAPHIPGTKREREKAGGGAPSVGPAGGWDRGSVCRAGLHFSAVLYGGPAGLAQPPRLHLLSAPGLLPAGCAWFPWVPWPPCLPRWLLWAECWRYRGGSMKQSRVRVLPHPAPGSDALLSHFSFRPQVPLGPLYTKI